MKTNGTNRARRPGAYAWKARTGIAGLDEITRGGLPRERNTVLLGGPGSGKTVLALQSLVNGARSYGEPGIFVAFEENTRQIVRNAASFGWNLPELERRNLFFLDARTRPESVTVGEFDIAGLLAGVGAQAKRMGAKRIVFDSIDVLLSSLDSAARERLEIQRLLDWLASSGLTGIVTGKLAEGSPGHGRRYDFLEFMADCAVLLSQHTVERFSQRELRVLKYRGSAFSENAAPMVIGPSGIEVAHISPKDRTFPVLKRRVTTGIDRLDAMMGGGYYRGSSVLITGAPGTAKSTLSAAFLAASCRRKERALYVSFDEIAGEHARNLASVGIDLRTPIDRGLLEVYSARTEASSIEEHLVRIHSLIREHRARSVVFDPLSSLFRTGMHSAAQSAASRLLDMTKSEGITTISTSVLTHPDQKVEGTPLEISTIADTWIHLSYAVKAGERNRALTIVKSRGMRHSNQVRELLLGRDGVTLADVYAADGEVLMGTLRLQRELADFAEQDQRQSAAEHRERELKLAEAELNARIAALTRELEMKRLDLADFRHDTARRRTRRGEHRSIVLQSRGADRRA